MLRSYAWKAVYRSETDNLLEDFYLPALKESVSYDRAVGFFSASMLSYAAQGISALVESDGRMRLIFGGELDEQDAQAIQEGYELRDLSRRLGDVILGEIDNLSDALANQRLAAMSWLVANGKLDIKVALKRRGMYHEKIGIFTDREGDSLIFQGSANETTYALLPDFNFESINVFPSWRTELEDHYKPYLEGFERLWNNQSLGTYVIDFPEGAKERLIKIAVRASRPPNAEIELDVWRNLISKPETADIPHVPTPSVPLTFKGAQFKIKEHQRDALNAWRSRDLHGILSMATGAGKTVTAIYGAVKLFEQMQRMFLVVAVPYQTLADQWLEELAIFGINAIPCYATVAQWGSQLTQAITLFTSNALSFCAVVVVNRTLQSEGFQERVQRIPGEVLVFIGDECHHHGGKGLYQALPQHARIRLGLSATPKHYFDEERTENLLKYYGEVAYEYALKDALRDGVLTPYDYYINFVDLTEEETEAYIEISEKISRIAGSAGAGDLDEPSDDQLKILLFRRSRLLGNAFNKIKLLADLIKDVKPQPFHLFYCGDGSFDGEDEAAGRQVDQVSKALYRNGWKVSHFTSRESRDARRRLLENFRVGLIDGLVAIRCLDEGVDIPDCRVAYILASSRNPKQFIQRRGRILRRAPNKEFAVIHDFIVRLPDSECGSGEIARKLLIAELARVSEFGALARNRSEVFAVLRPLLEKYDLHHYFA